MPVALNGDSHVDRPASKTILPFRADRTQREGLSLTCFGKLRDGQKWASTIAVGDPDSEVAEMYNPVGKAIWELMKMFWNLEASIDPVMQERDNLRVENEDLKGQLKREKSRTADLQQRMDRKSGK